jgi:putative sterol carrier protein
VLATALAWLRARTYAPRRVALCWGDARMPNLLFRDDAVAAVLDWEMAFVGDPGADVGWWCFLDWANTEGWGAPHLDGIPGREETLARYAALTGHAVEHPEWQEVFAAFRYGAILARVGARLKAIGASVPTPDFETNNPCTQALARLLGLPPPGVAQAATTRAGRADGAEIRLQLHLAGEGGSDWWVAVRGGVATRHVGTAPSADAVLRATFVDWRAVQTGALDRLAAFLDGKIRIEGDPTLFMVHEAIITRLAEEAA